MPSARAINLEALLHPLRYPLEISIHLSRLLATDEVHNRLPSHVNVLEGPENVDLGISQHNPRPARVLDGVFCLAVLSSNTADRTAQVISLQGLYVLDLERLDVELVDPEKSDGVGDLESHGEGLDKVLTPLEGIDALGRLLGAAQLDDLARRIHADLELEVLDQWRVYLGPLTLERGHAVRRDGDFSLIGAMGLLVGDCGERRPAFEDVFSSSWCGCGVGHVDINSGTA